MNRKRFWLGYLLGVVVGVVVAAFGIYRLLFTPPSLELRSLELLDLEGRPFPTAQLRGRPVVFNRWATWCVGCLAEFPDFEQVKRQTQRPVLFLMASDEPAVKIKAFLKKHPYSFTFVRLKKPIPGLNVLPATYIYDTQGELLTAETGQLHAPELVELLVEAAE